MQLQLLNFQTLVANAAAAVQGSARQLIDLTIGSTLRAILEANASLALWMQWLIVQVLASTRASTSSGADLDTWMADFSFARLPSSVGAGQALTIMTEQTQTIVSSLWALRGDCLFQISEYHVNIFGRLLQQSFQVYHR